MSQSTPPPPDGGDPAPQPPTNPYGTPSAGGPPPPAPPGGYAGQPAGGYSPAGPPPPGYGPEGYQQQGYGPATSGPGRPADLMPRFLARLIDYVLLFFVYVIISIAFGIGSFVTQGDGRSYGLNALLAIIGTVLYVGYFTLLEARNGQTVGKMALKLRTRGPDGSTVTTQQALKRNLFNGTWVLGILPFLGVLNPLLWLAACIVIAVQINQSPSRQAWHDTFAGGTQVVTAG